MKATNVNTSASVANDNVTNSSSNNEEAGGVTERTSKMSISAAPYKPESNKTSSKNGKQKEIKI